MAADKKTLLRDALKQVQTGKIDKAVETYKAIIKLDPRDAAVHNTLGDLLVRLGKKKEAIAEFLEVAAMYEKDGFALRAVAMCQKAINLDPELIAVRIKLGDLYSSQKLAAEGRSHYMQAANYYDKKGEVVNALEIFRKIANLEPDNLSVRVKLAGMFEKQKFPVKAAEEYVRAAQGYADKKEMNTAVQLYVRAFKLSPGNNEARRRLADFYAQRQDWSVVVGLLETPVVKGSNEADLLVLYAEALTRVNHPQEAVKVLVPAQEREPNSLPVNQTLGRAYLKAGDLEKGAAAINRCVSVYLAENRFEPADLLLGELAEAAPDDDKVFQRVLEVAQKRGEKGAIAKAYFKLAEVYEKKNLVRNATGAIEKYLEIKPGDPAATRFLEKLQEQVPAPKVEAPPPPQVVAPAPPPPAAPEEEDLVEITLEDDGLASVGDLGGEEELLVEVEDETVAAPTAEPTSVAEALAVSRQGASEKASEFLEDRLGRDPGDAEAWQALIEVRRHLGNTTGVRDGFLRLANLHRVASRFEEARAAYKGALDADPRSAVAARGLADLLVEEEEAVAPPPVASPAAEAKINLDLVEQEAEETQIVLEPERPPAPEPLLQIEPESGPEALHELDLEFEPEAETLLELDLEPEPEPEQKPQPEPKLGLEIEPEPEPEAVAAPPLAPEAVPQREPEPEPEPVLAAEPEAAPEAAPEPVLQPEPAVAPEAAFESAGVDEVSFSEPAPQFWDYQDFVEAPAEAAPPEAVAEEQPPSAPGFDEITLDSLAEESVGSGSQVAEPPSPVPAAAAPVGTGTAEFEEFLAEADFYFQQGLVDEAEFLYSKLLRISPGHPAVTMQLRKLEDMRSVAPAGPVGPDIVDLDEALDMAFGGESPGSAVEEAPPAGKAPAPPEKPAAGPDLDIEISDFSDFVTALHQEGGSPAPPEPHPAAPLQGGEGGLNEIFQEFQRSVKEQLGDEDFETHYNLGIAYKEMGLMEEAIGEFALAEKSPVRRLNAVSMIALCLREVGRVDEAALKLRTGISLAVEGSEDQKGFLYDLAGLHEQAGRATDAQETLRRLMAIDPGYRDVAARVGAAPAAPSAPPRKKSKVSYL